jgi:SAM-dependent methyltransferase
MSKYIDGKELTDRVRFVQGSVDDQSAVSNLGKFDLVYSTFSLHHWDDPVKSLKTLYDAVGEGGMLYIHDLKRVWWLYWIPGKSGDLRAIRASYNNAEVKNMLRDAGIPDGYILKTPFPYFWHSLILQKG